MNRSPEIKELALALSKAQAEIKDASRHGENPHFGSHYATLSDVWDVCRGPLSKNGLSIIQSPSTTPEGAIRVTTLLAHGSGQWLEDSLELYPRDKGPQAAGSAISYARRYSLMSIVGVTAADDDDDGNAATHAHTNRPAPARFKEPQALGTIPKKSQTTQEEHPVESNQPLKASPASGGAHKYAKVAPEPEPEWGEGLSPILPMKEKNPLDYVFQSGSKDRKGRKLREFSRVQLQEIVDAAGDFKTKNPERAIPPKAKEDLQAIEAALQILT